MSIALQRLTQFGELGHKAGVYAPWPAEQVIAWELQSARSNSLLTMTV